MGGGMFKCRCRQTVATVKAMLGSRNHPKLSTGWQGDWATCTIDSTFVYFFSFYFCGMPMLTKANT